LFGANCVEALIINVVVNKKFESVQMYVIFSFRHAVRKTFLPSHLFQYFGGGSIGVWQNRVYGKPLVEKS